MNETIPERCFTLIMPAGRNEREFATEVCDWLDENIGEGNFMVRIYHNNRIAVYIPEEKNCLFLKLRWSDHFDRD